MIEIVREAEDNLTRQVWKFYIQAGYPIGPVKITLSEYDHEIRKTRRHKWVSDTFWQRIPRNGYGRAYNMKDADVPLPEDVCLEAVEFVRSRIAVAEVGK